MIDVPLFRKTFKPLMAGKFESLLQKRHDIKSDLEIRCVFEFREADFEQVINILNKMYKALELSSQIQKIGAKNFKPFSTHLDRGLLSEGLKSMSSDLFLSLMDKYSFFTNPAFKVELKVEMYNENLNFKGTYLKFSRELGQSPWFIDGERLCETSVEEEIKNGIMKFVNCDGASLHAGGREDRDVRMLGGGRPFIIEIFNPRNRIS